MIVDVNNFTDYTVNEDELNRILRWLSTEEPGEIDSVDLAFVGDDRMKEANETFYNEEGTTDVLTFDYEDGSIEILLNPEQHERQAPAVGHSTNEETIVNLVHGYLHACGYDHLRDDGEHLERQRELFHRLLESEPSLLDVPEDVA